MEIKTNYHTHCALCRHAEGTIEDYIKRAVELGYTELGISDHGPLTYALEETLFSRRMSIDEYKELYLPDLFRLIDKYKDQIKVYSAVEIEYFNELLPYYPEMASTLDYLILGQHYFMHEGRYISVYSQLDYKMIEEYALTIISAMDSGYFKILAHPDIFCWGYPIWDDLCTELSKKIISSAIKNNCLLEINSNGIRNCERKGRYTVDYDNETKEEVHRWAYPNYEFFKIAKDMGAKIIINEDCHEPIQLSDEATVACYDFAKKLGIKPVNKLEI